VQISQSPAFEENDHVEQNLVLEMNQQMEEDDGFQPLFDYSKVYDSPPKFQEGKYHALQLPVMSLSMTDEKLYVFGWNSHARCGCSIFRLAL
jgi:hypothetical protein